MNNLKSDVYRHRIILVLFFLPLMAVSAQNWESQPWPASWITHPTAPAAEFAVVNFRRTFELTSLPDSLLVMVSADNRYQLFVNGRRAGEGPSRGDLLHWRYETYDLKPYLQKGKNVVAAIVWNYGIDRPWSQESYRLGFMLQPKSAAGEDLLTDNKWKTHYNEAYSPILGSRERLGSYIVTGPQLRIDGNQMPWGWEYEAYDDNNWLPAKTITRASPASGGTEIYWGLVPREIPDLLRGPPLPLHTYKKWRTDEKYEQRLLEEGESLEVRANGTVTFLIDMEKVRNVFPGFTTFGGAGTSIQISYAESLVDENNSKGHRDSIRNKRMRGIYDVFIVSDTASTSHGFKYGTPFFRTARYLELKIVTQKEPIRIGSFFPETFAYPFKQSGSFTDSTEHNRTEEIWNVGWQTARMCAQETYVDCPYYEQLQYVGDTRIQALISLYVSGDDWLMRKAIKMFDESRTTEGLTASRYPSNVPQVIPPYSLAWVEMVGDYWMHRPDTAFVRARLEGVRAVLNWYEQQQLPNGLIGPTPYWNFVDWTDDWPWNPILRIGGVPDLEDGSSIISLQYVSALRTAAKLFAYFGDATRANAYNYKADGVAEAVSKLCWNAQREMFSDTPKGVAFSQHANIMALLTDLVPAAAPEIMKRGSEGLPAFRDRMLGEILTDEALTPVSEYFRFFLVQAMYHTGNAHLYQDQLKIWEAYLDQGFTTFPEKPGETRSDCHAWSASPNYDLPATLAGIRPSSPGFQTVSIRPAAYGFEAKVPHPNGMIIVQVSEQQMGGYEEWDIIVNYRIELPPGVTGTLSTGDKSGEVALVEGVNEFQAIWQGY